MTELEREKLIVRFFDEVFVPAIMQATFPRITKSHQPDTRTIDNLSVDVRTYNAIKNWAHYRGVPDLTADEMRAMSDKDLLKMKNFGRKSLLCLRAALADPQ